MTFLWKMILAGFVLAVMATTLLVKADEINQAAADHRAKAASYQQKA